MSNPLEVAGGVALALLPSLAWLYYFYRQDRYEPEPLGLLARAFLAGALAVPAAAALERLALPWVTGAPFVSLGQLDFRTLEWAVLLVIAPVEETLKFAAAWIAVGRHPEYDEPVDGVVYATAAALGFAAAENLLYLAATGTQVLFLRGLFSCFLHATCTGLIGYAWSQVRFDGCSRFRLLFAWMAAVAAHGVFDLIAFGHSQAALLKLGVVLVVVDVALTARIGKALQNSPFRPPEEDESE